MIREPRYIRWQICLPIGNALRRRARRSPQKSSQKERIKLNSKLALHCSLNFQISFRIFNSPRTQAPSRPVLDKPTTDPGYNRPISLRLSSLERLGPFQSFDLLLRSSTLFSNSELS